MQGDVKAFADLFERYRRDLYAMCARRLKDPSMAEDVVQEVFLRAFKSFPKSDYHKPMRPWLATIALRICIDLQRHRSFTYYSDDVAQSLDAEDNRESDAQSGSVLDEVIASEERAELWESLSILTRRQRRAMVLYAVDGWSCADIASAEGISVGAVKLLLFRARRKLRATRENGLPSLVVIPVTWFRERIHEAGERSRLTFGVISERLSGAGTFALSLCMLSAIAVTMSPAEPFEDSDQRPPGEAILSVTQAQPLQTAPPGILAPSKTKAQSSPSLVEGGTLLGGEVIDSTESATPENTSFNSITVSPNYENDHTLLASGYFIGKSPFVLFVSKDGGANWEPLPSISLLGSNLILSPAYPQDRRIFALGDLGLQQSDDGGAIFRTVSSSLLGAGFAISPSFGRGDSKVLIAGKALLEYDASTGVTQPSLLPIPVSFNRILRSVTFSPDYSSDRTVFVSDGVGAYRCEQTLCSVASPMTLRLSPRFGQDGLAYAFSYREFQVSNDGARTFREISFPLPDDDSIADVAILWHESSEPAIFVSTLTYRSTAEVYRSFDGGLSWSGTSIDLPGFSLGAKRLTITPTVRLLAAGGSGIACSVDAGQTWASRCPPEL